MKCSDDFGVVPDLGVVEELLEFRRSIGVESTLGDGQVLGQLVAAEFLVGLGGIRPAIEDFLIAFLLFGHLLLSMLGHQIDKLLAFFLRKIVFLGQSLELAGEFGVYLDSLGNLELFVFLGSAFGFVVIPVIISGVVVITVFTVSVFVATVLAITGIVIVIAVLVLILVVIVQVFRSEERRVGKECRL